MRRHIHVVIHGEGFGAPAQCCIKEGRFPDPWPDADHRTLGGCAVVFLVTHSFSRQMKEILSETDEKVYLRIVILMPDRLYAGGA
jgi:hypothetical protein